MPVRQLVLLATAAVVVAAAPAATGSTAATAAYPGVPSLYVTYQPPGCTFTMSADGGISVAATSPPGPTLPPGVYQIQVLMENTGAGYACGTPSFTLKGPNVSSATVFPGESILDDHLLPALQPSSTYVAEDENAPGATRVYFTTAAAGSSGSLLGSTPSGTGTNGTGSSQGDIVGSALPPIRGRLQATVGRDGTARIVHGGRTVSTLKAGRYTLVVRDDSKAAGLSLAPAHGRARALTSRRYVGEKTLEVTLTAGSWTFVTQGGKARPFVVTR